MAIGIDDAAQAPGGYEMTEGQRQSMVERNMAESSVMRVN
jgi:hypothetical protein